ncbi:barstar family protein [Streptomyces sp. NPDC004082]|uniref:barstar family protein n=1 Tax=Streptomyces sp. NPDC005481 TaxID=3154881 RepID=UPI0033B1543A
MRPPKYALVAYDQDAEYEAENRETWALCAEAEDLCADPPAPTRARYTLLGCGPEGRLRTALTRSRAEGSAPVGVLVLTILDGRGEPVEEWALEDVRVLGDRPCARDLALRDVVVEASESADNPFDYPQCPPLSPGYRIHGETGESHGTCKDLARTREEEPTTESSLRLLGCTPRGALREAMDAGEEDLGHAAVLRLDAHGRTVQEAVEGEITAWIPSARGPGLVDLALEPWSERPPSAAPEVWDLWWDGRPTEPGLWARLSPEGRSAWLGTALANHPHGGPDPPAGTTFHLDGRHVTDLPAFFCALGEAVNGPGGYFGWGLDAVTDCLRGRWGARQPLTLVWHDADVARSCLGPTPHVSRRPWTFEELVAFLTEEGVDLRLA